jgi:hypothetical protein
MVLVCHESEHFLFEQAAGSTGFDRWNGAAGQ